MSNVHLVSLRIVGLQVNPYEPYKLGNTTVAIASGTIIKINNNNFVITNAHCVPGSDHVYATKFNSAKEFVLKIITVAPELDLAILNTDDPEFYRGLIGLEFGPSPALGAAIYVLGYPHGGLHASRTEGIFSRFETVALNDSVRHNVVGTTAAINPGCSGGPAFIKDTDKPFGIAFGHRIGAQNVCYILPYNLIMLFIKAFTSTHGYQGIGDLGFYSQELSNENLQEYYGCTHGVLINEVFKTGSCNVALKPGDVLLAIDNLKINADSTVGINKSGEFCELDDPDLIGRSTFQQVVRSQKLPGDTVHLTYMRNKQVNTVKITLDKYIQPLLAKTIHYISPNYYIYAGLIWIICSNSYLFEPDSENLDRFKAGLYKYLGEMPEFPGEQIIVLHDIIPSVYTTGYKFVHKRLISVNDIKIKNLAHLIKICEKECDRKFMKFELENNEIIITACVTPEICETITQNAYHITHKNAPNI